MAGSIQLPSEIRLMSDAEYLLVTRGGGDIWPYRARSSSTDAGEPAAFRRTLAAVASSFLVCLACDPVLSVRGTVHNRSGAPLEDVALILDAEGRGPHQARSVADGSFEISMVGAPNATLLFSKPGYKPIAVPVRSEQVLQVVLDR